MTNEIIVRTIAVSPADRRIGGRETIPRWSDMSRLALGAWTFLMPCLAALLAMASLTYGTTVPPAFLGATFGLLIAHAMITLLYIAFAGQNPRIEHSRTMWFLAIVLAGPVAIPVYWFIHVLHAPHIGRHDIDGAPPGIKRSQRVRQVPLAA